MHRSESSDSDGTFDAFDAEIRAAAVERLLQMTESLREHGRFKVHLCNPLQNKGLQRWNQSDERAFLPQSVSRLGSYLIDKLRALLGSGVILPKEHPAARLAPTRKRPSISPFPHRPAKTAVGVLGKGLQ